MKTVKPQRLGVLHRTFENDGRCFFVPTVMVCFGFDAPEVPVHEAAMWKMVADTLPTDIAPDEAMRKTRGEVLVSGLAHPPRGAAAIACAVRLQMGAIDKRLYVVGDRRWERTGPSAPVPFTEMPVTWANAFGGGGFEENPGGKGHAPVEGVHLLPNVEDPKRLITSPGDRPRPVGLGPLDISHPRRRKRAGTYDKRWLDERFPGLPADLDWLFFNTASEDQWLEGYFSGGESFALEGMHPTRPRVEGRVPRLAPRCFVTRAGDAEKALHEVALNLDTLHLFPNSERGIAFYRGLTEVAEDDAADLGELLVACEAKGQPRPTSHYQDVLRKRLDPKKGAFFALRDSDLLPPLPDGVDPMGTSELGSELAVLTKPEGLLQENLQRSAQKELDRAREVCRQHDIDPDQHLPKQVTPPRREEPDLEHLDAFVEQQKAEAEKARAELEKHKEEALARARKMCAEQNVDFDALQAKAREEAGGPPRFRASEQMDHLREMAKLSGNAGVPMPAVEAALADPKLYEKLLATERQLVDAYRRAAHQLSPARRLGPDESLRLRVMVQAAHDAGESLAGRDLTGADLSRVDLSGADLRGALLEAADLRGANLEGAQLEGAVLVRADLGEARLAGARLAGANLGEAKIHKTDLSGADLSGAVLMKAELFEANLEGALLEKAMLLEVTVRGGRFAKVRANKLVLNKLDLSDAVFTGAELPECILLEARLDRTDFSGARLEGACLLGVVGEGARFDGARADNLRVVYGTALPGASFRGASLVKANFRGIDLAGADFGEADLTGADLSEANLTGANLERIVAKDAVVIRGNLQGARLGSANLMRAVLQKSHVEGADLRNANLFRVDFAKVVGDKQTRFEGANINQMRIVKRREHGRA